MAGLPLWLVPLPTSVLAEACRRKGIPVYLDESEFQTPCLQANPISWTRNVFLAQHSHEKLLLKAMRTEKNFNLTMVHDKMPMPVVTNDGLLQLH